MSNPNLLQNLKKQTKEHFCRMLIEGHGNMVSYSGNKTVVNGVDDQYAYLKGRSDGAIPAGDLTEMK